MTPPDNAVAAPALPLRPFVSHYAGSRMRDVPQGQHAGLPSRHLDLIVSLAKPVEIARMPGAQSPGAYDVFVAGLQQTPALVRMGGDLDCLHVFLKPGAARALLGVGGQELASRVADVATASGFHDQAHMVREWHALAGCTPRDWLRSQLPFLQDYEIGEGHD